MHAENIYLSGNRRLPRSRESSSDKHVVLFRNFSFDDFGAELDWSTRTNSRINRIRNLIKFNKSPVENRCSLFPWNSRLWQMLNTHVILILLVCHQFLKNALLFKHFSKGNMRCKRMLIEIFTTRFAVVKYYDKIKKWFSFIFIIYNHRLRIRWTKLISK